LLPRSVPRPSPPRHAFVHGRIRFAILAPANTRERPDRGTRAYAAAIARAHIFYCPFPGASPAREDINEPRTLRDDNGGTLRDCQVFELDPKGTIVDALKLDFVSWSDVRVGFWALVHVTLASGEYAAAIYAGIARAWSRLGCFEIIPRPSSCVSVVL